MGLTMCLKTLHILTREILAKPLTSSDVITVLVGLDLVDREFMEFVSRLELLMRRGATRKLNREFRQSNSVY